MLNRLKQSIASAKVWCAQPIVDGRKPRLLTQMISRDTGIRQLPQEARIDRGKHFQLAQETSPKHVRQYAPVGSPWRHLQPSL